MTIKINGDNTVANPGFSGDDTDTGLQVGTNELKLVTGGTARATVDSSGTSTFAGNIVSGNTINSSSTVGGTTIYSVGGIYASYSGSNPVFVAKQNGSAATKAEIKADGSATFASDVLAGDFNFADATTAGCILEENGGVQSKIRTGNTHDAFTGYLGNTTVTSIKYDGSATFAGSVGIGTTSAGRNLVVNGGSSEGVLQITNNTSGTGAANGLEILCFTSGEAQFLNRENAAMRFDTNNTERMRIDSSGKLLIGSSTGSALGDRLLQVGKTDRASTYISIVNSTSGNGGLLFADTTSNDTGGYRGQVVYAHASDSMQFWTGATERMRISSGGIVSIPNGVELGAGFNGAAANTLDDYEEGTWTPSVSGFTTSGTVTTAGKYVKVGRQVTFGLKFKATGTIASGVSCNISLPFTMTYGDVHNGLINMYLNSNSEAQNSNKNGNQCKLDGEGGARFFVGSFTTTSSGQELLFGGTYIAAS